ncbi:MAG: hypothetical protein SOZ89_02720 [Peptoniphilaceae bacterium]|nr:hypothetical protein [Peptoniphilaceae bacterium]MDY3738017.1 hypothetical protein [Peptoniphilaceae bacterium]
MKYFLIGFLFLCITICIIYISKQEKQIKKMQNQIDALYKKIN